MPLLFLERFPWPSLQTYTTLSVALLAGSIFSAYNTVTEQGFGGLETDEPQSPAASQVESEDADGEVAGTELASTVLWYLVTDSLFVWVSWCKDGVLWIGVFLVDRKPGLTLRC